MTPPNNPPLFSVCLSQKVPSTAQCPLNWNKVPVWWLRKRGSGIPSYSFTGQVLRTVLQSSQCLSFFWLPLNDKKIPRSFLFLQRVHHIHVCQTVRRQTLWSPFLLTLAEMAMPLGINSITVLKKWVEKCSQHLSQEKKCHLSSFIFHVWAAEV